MKIVLSRAAVRLQRGLSDLVKLRSEERVSTGAEQHSPVLLQSLLSHAVASIF